METGKGTGKSILQAFVSKQPLSKRRSGFSFSPRLQPRPRWITLIIHAPQTKYSILSATHFCRGDFATSANSGKRILDARILDPNSWVFFLLVPVFSSKRGPQKNSPSRKFTSQKSPSKIQPRNREKIFTLHLCRAIWLINLATRSREFLVKGTASSRYLSHAALQCCL